MTPSPTASPTLEAYRDGLLAAAEAWPSLAVAEAGLAPEAASSPFAARFPARYLLLPSLESVELAAERCRGGGRVFVGALAPSIVGEAYPAVVRALLAPRLNVTLVGFGPDSAPLPGRSQPAVRDDLGTMRAVPGMTVVAPADGPSARAATLALAERDGPAYLRLPPPDAPTIGEGAFAVGRAAEVRSGSDLTIVGLGRMLQRSVEVADELAQVGVSVRVLDGASVKPFDEAAVLRAARDTGAILVVEDAPVAGGIGTLVAAMTAENFPVPVRRLGLPDLWSGHDGPLDEVGLSLERVRDEAFELLRVRGRIT